MITTFYPPYSFGGDAVFVQRLSNELARRGHHVEVIHCVDAYRAMARGDPASTYEDDPGIVVHGLRSPAGLLSPLATQQTGYPLFKSTRIREVLDQGFDVIHFHNVSLVGGPGILRYGRALKLYTMHEHWLVCPSHVLFKYNRAVCQKPNCFTCQIAHGRPPQWWRYTRLLNAMIAHVDAFIAPSRFVMERHRSMGIGPDVRMVVMPNFVPQAPPPASPAGTPPRPYFLFAGRLEKLKGAQTVIPIFRRYAGAPLIIAGTGSINADLQRLASGSANVRFLGQQSPERVRALMRGAVALIVPSICFEAFPTVTLEAFSQGTPAIVRDIGSLPEQIEQSEGGLVYETDTELVAAMDQLLADRTYRDSLGRHALSAYNQRWTPEAHMEHYLRLIGELSAQHGRTNGDRQQYGAARH